MRLQFQNGMSEHDKKELHLLQAGFLEYKWCPICKAALSTGGNGKKYEFKIWRGIFRKEQNCGWKPKANWCEFYNECEENDAIMK